MIEPSVDEIVACLSTFWEPATFGEVRAIGGKTHRVMSGYFGSEPTATDGEWHDDLYRGAETIVKTDRIEMFEGIYFLPQPLIPEHPIPSERRNRLVPTGSAVTDLDVERYRWLFLDFDPVRLARRSSSELELLRSGLAARRVGEVLIDLTGEIPAYVGMSGNGHHLIYRVDFGIDQARTIKRTLGVVNDHLGAIGWGSVKCDASTYNPARIWKLYGTIARKGTATKETPHRRASLADWQRHVEEYPDDDSLVERAFGKCGLAGVVDWDLRHGEE